MAFIFLLLIHWKAFQRNKKNLVWGQEVKLNDLYPSIPEGIFIVMDNATKVFFFHTFHRTLNRYEPKMLLF